MSTASPPTAGLGTACSWERRRAAAPYLELSPPARKGDPWTETILHSFKSGKDGYFPWGSLTFDAQGNLYGATQFGGGKGTTCNPYYQYCGTVFELSPPKQKGRQWTERVLHSFGEGSDGASPQGRLVFDKKGAIYGTTYWGGGSQNCNSNVGVGCGTVFQLSPPKVRGGKWTEKLLHAFVSGNDGAEPNAGLVLDGERALYGTTMNGGVLGIVFRLAPSGDGHWQETILYTFDGGKGGRSPGTGLTRDLRGNLYGTTEALFRMKPPVRKGGRWTLEVLYTFTGSPDGWDPDSIVIDGGDVIYGTTLQGGTGGGCQGGCGTVFKASP
jgi:hypothetical protein